MLGQMDIFDALLEAAAEQYAEDPVCRCAGAREKGFRLDPDTGWWVHALCGQPSRLYYERVVRDARR